jgi:dipeptidyl aminopeptidase/acylaminoacyl peptidase
MRSIGFSLALFLSSFALAPLAHAQSSEAPAPIDLSAYGSLPEVEQATISPSGNRIALVTTIDGQRVILAIENQEKAIAKMGVGDAKIRGLEWVGEDRLLLTTSMTQKLGIGFTTDKAELYLATILPISKDAAPGRIFEKQRNLVDTVSGNYGVRQIDGRWYGFFGAIELVRDQRNRGKFQFEHGRPALYRVDLQDFSTKKMARSADWGHDNDWVVDANGEVAAIFDIDDNSGTWTLKGEDGKRIAKGQNKGGRTWLIGLGYDGTSVIMGDNTGGFTRWLEFPLAGGEPKPFLFNENIDRLYFSETTGHLLGYLEDGPKPKPVFKDPAHTKGAEKVRKAFSKLEMDMIDWTDDVGQMIVRTSGNQDSGTWFAVDIGSLRANAVAYERLAIGPEHVGPISTFEYEASDGLKLDGILTLPPGKEAKNLPLVMLPHGGPHSYDAPEFDWWAQAFASRGYAVFQPNFRGSTHRSQAFRAAGYGEWGRKMQSDKTDGLKALAAKGIIDPERACIVGASYGGYAALAGVTVEQGVYQCAVAVAPVSDIRNMYTEDYRASARDRTTKVALLEQLGDRKLWNENSPLRLAERADAPIMLIHGKDDVVVPYSHSTKMADKLKDHGKPYEMVTLDGEDHWLSLSDTRQKMLSAAVGFVQKHNPAD